MDSDLINVRLGNYRIQRLLGRGGFAEVYLGEQVYLKTAAAIKLLNTRQQNTQHFVQEARLLASLRHPRIVSILEFDLYNDRPFLVMEYLPHGTLRQRFPYGSRLPVETMVTCIEQMAEALDYLHGRGLAHGDVKPENMLLGAEDQLYLSDFGIAILASRQQGQALAGTVTYMAPEQLRHQIQPASDQYALGIIAYEWLCGEPPFTGSYIEVATQHAFTPPEPLRERIPDLPAEIEAVILRALAKEPGARFSSAGAFATALSNAYYGTLPTERRERPSATQPASTTLLERTELSAPTQTAQSLDPPSSKKASRRLFLVASGIGVTALGLAGVTSLLWRKSAQGAASQAQPTVIEQPVRPQGSVYYVYHKQRSSIVALAWSPDGTRIASASSDFAPNNVLFNPNNPSNPSNFNKEEHLIHVWDALTGEHLAIYQGHAGIIYALAWSPDGKHIASGGAGNDATGNTSLQVWESATGKPVVSLKSDYSFISQIYWHEANEILAMGGASGNIIRWDPFANKSDIRRFAQGGIYNPITCSVSPDGKYVIVDGDVYNLANGKQISTDKTVGGYANLLFPFFWSPNSQRCITQHNRLPPEVWDPLTGQQLVAFEQDFDSTSIDWSPDSRKVASCGRAGAIFIWNASNGSMLYKYTPRATEITSIAWSPNGSMIASGGDKGSIEVWKAV